MTRDSFVAEALACWAHTDGAVWQPMGGGLINHTWSVRTARGDLVLQRVNRLFDPAIHHNIRAVTARLTERGMATPRLMPTADGALWADLAAGRAGADPAEGPPAPGEDPGLWRVMTRVPGYTLDVPDSPDQAASAAALLARFHAALADPPLPHAWVGLRVGVHDTARHLARLREALADCPDHPLRADVAALAGPLLAAADALPPPDPALPATPVHGDPKLNNVIFAGAGRAVCLVDLDTVGPMPLWQELGDAWRSWCNRAGEDDASGEAVLDLPTFESTAAAYLAAAADAGAPPWTDAGRAALLHAPEWISLELAARFAADALRETWFGWDSESGRFARAGEHNLLRARVQASLHRAFVGSRAARARALAGP